MCRSRGRTLIWGRVKATDESNDSFYVSIDGSDYVLWDTPESNTWFWDQVSNRGGDDPVTYYLKAGEHTLVVKQREDGTKLDKILVTEDMDYVPNRHPISF